MTWKKLGLIFDLARHSIPWLKSHAMLPSPLLLEDRLRVYFTGRDGNGQSRISFVDLRREDPTQIMYVHDRPLLPIGKPGTFDDSGTLATCAVRQGAAIYLYYNGYNRRVVVPWSNAIGLALSQDGGLTFEKMYEGPVVDRTAHEPYLAISPSIWREAGVWHMWYTSGTGWLEVRGVQEPLYIIKYAQSTDGISWQRENQTCVYPQHPEEAIGRPAVIKDGAGFKMWFCFRGSRDFRGGRDSYRLGYAEAVDAVHWNRDDLRAGLAGGPDAWDSQIQAYPAVVTVENKRYLFYNGNGFGAAGFGCAVWE